MMFIEQGTFEPYHSLNVLNEKIGDNARKRRCAHSLICRYNKEFKILKKSNLPWEMKQKIFIDVVHRYKHSIFSDVSKLNEDEKRWLYHFIITKWRKYREVKLKKIRRE